MRPVLCFVKRSVPFLPMFAAACGGSDTIPDEPEDASTLDGATADVHTERSLSSRAETVQGPGGNGLRTK